MLLDKDYLRFLHKVKIPENIQDCWLWQGKLNNGGYGGYRFRGKVYGAHVASFIFHKEELLKGLEIDHLCKTPACVNPYHLEAVTHLENVRRSEAGKITGQRRLDQTHCIRGHEYTPENTLWHGARQKRRNRQCRECWKAHAKKANAKRRCKDITR